jgi:hypothetical protein
MPTELTAVQKAQAAAAEATAAAERASDAAEITFLDEVTHVKQIREGRTERDAQRLKSRYISVLGLPRWTALIANSR